MIDPETPLPRLKLKYFSRPSRIPTGPPVVKDRCIYCRSKIYAIGSVMDAYSAKPRYTCEDCAILAYQDQYGFRTKRAAAARRRRLFDAGYLFQELVMEEYATLHGLKNPKALEGEEYRAVLAFGSEAYNHYFSKEDKIRLEEIVEQDGIEEQMRLFVGLAAKRLKQLGRRLP